MRRKSGDPTSDRNDDRPRATYAISCLRSDLFFLHRREYLNFALVPTTVFGTMHMGMLSKPFSLPITFGAPRLSQGHGHVPLASVLGFFSRLAVSRGRS